jgi:hypothetical protein
MTSAYIRDWEGKRDTMIEIAPREFVNTISAAKLGLMRPEHKALLARQVNTKQVA